MKRVLVIGAGPAGLTAAFELLKTGCYEVVVLEENMELGGISRTINTDGNRMDIGGHRFFSKEKQVTDWWLSFLTPQGYPSLDDALLSRDKQLAPDGADPGTADRVMLIRERVSRIYYKNSFFNYPLTLDWRTIQNIGLLTTVRAGFSYIFAHIRKRPENNLENFYINRFGKVLYAMFFEGYTEKVWGRHPREISEQWGAQRVKGLSVTAILKDMFGRLFRIKNRVVETSLIEQFFYPKFGPGQLWTEVADKIREMGGKIETNKCVKVIVRGADGNINKVICTDDTEVRCDILISSMAVKDLEEALDNVPENISYIAKGLPYRDFQTVGILLPIDKFRLRNAGSTPTVGGIAPDCWLYIQDQTVKLGRIQVFNNWSPYMVKDLEHTVWIGLEYFCNEGDRLWEMTDEAFIRFAADELVQIGVIASAGDILLAHREKVKKAYPAYFDTYDEFSKLREFLDTIPNLYCVGRNGQHRYNNMDHSMLTAYAAVDCIIHDKMDRSTVWNVNTEGEYHETKTSGT